MMVFVIVLGSVVIAAEVAILVWILIDEYHERKWWG